jgi:hypothetical protein
MMQNPDLYADEEDQAQNMELDENFDVDIDDAPNDGGIGMDAEE